MQRAEVAEITFTYTLSVLLWDNVHIGFYYDNIMSFHGFRKPPSPRPAIWEHDVSNNLGIFDSPAPLLYLIKLLLLYFETYFNFRTRRSRVFVTFRDLIKQ